MGKLFTNFKLPERKLLYRLSILLIIILGIMTYHWLSYHFTYSRDAYVYANVINVNSQVPGNINKLYVHDNQAVKAGDKLFSIDARPYEYKVEQARANLALAKNSYQTTLQAITTATADLNQKQALLSEATDHLQRYQDLNKSGDIAKIVYVNMRFRVLQLQAEVSAAKEKLAIAKQQLTLDHIKKAKAELKTALYNLAHTTIYATHTGYVTNFHLQTDDYIKTGQALFALVDTKHWWVITRYRETVLRKIHPGDPADIKIDMYPHKEFHGIVDSISWGINRIQSSSKAAHSTLTYVEPTEYWIRIAQRFPVRILITNTDPEYPLRVGANAHTTVKNKSSS